MQEKEGYLKMIKNQQQVEMSIVMFKINLQTSNIFVWVC